MNDLRRVRRFSVDPIREDPQGIFVLQEEYKWRTKKGYVEAHRVGWKAGYADAADSVRKSGAYVLKKRFKTKTGYLLRGDPGTLYRAIIEVTSRAYKAGVRDQKRKSKNPAG